MLSSFFISFFLSVAVGASPDSQALLSLQKNFKSHQAFKVNFRQEVDQQLFSDESGRAEGLVEFKKPHFLKWIYQKPEKRLIQYDGKQLIVDGEKIHQAGAISLEQAFAFLWGQVDEDVFQVKALSPKRLELRVKDELETSFKKIEVLVENSTVKEALIYDHVGGTSKLVFSDWKFN